MRANTVTTRAVTSLVGGSNKRAVIGKGDHVEVVAGVVGIESSETAVLALHSHQPIQRATHALGITIRLARLMHGPGDHGGIIEIRVVAVRKLKRPAAAGQCRAIHPPVPGFVQQLPRLQPVERPNRRLGRGRVADLLHRENGEGRIPNRRYAGLAVSARRPHDQELLQCALCGHTPRIVGGITENDHGFQGIDHGRKDGPETVFAVEPLEHPLLGQAGRAFAHARRNQGINQAPQSIRRQKHLGQETLAPEIMRAPLRAAW